MLNGSIMQLLMYCEAVTNGSKPVAMMSIKTDNTGDAEETILRYNPNLKYHIQNSTDEQWKTLYVYKYDYLLDVIKNLPTTPKTIYDHWVLGKLFGYSDEAIAEFLKHK